MAFTITGSLSSGPTPPHITVTWSAGGITGSRADVELVEAIAATYDGQAIGPVNGPWTQWDHLSSALSTRFLLLHVLDWSTMVETGDLPTAPPLPDGYDS